MGFFCAEVQSIPHALLSRRVLGGFFEGVARVLGFVSKRVL